jgi:hypothetical protein
MRGVGAGLVERLARLGEFDLFESIRDENGDLDALQSFSGHDCSILSSRVWDDAIELTPIAPFAIDERQVPGFEPE